MKYLITGVAGFVAEYLIEHLANTSNVKDIWGVDVRPPSLEIMRKYPNLNISECSLLDRKALETIIETVKPDRIIHLAAYSSVAYSWKYPVECFLNNTNIFLNLVDVIRNIGLDCQLLSVGSSEEYGRVSIDELPLKESCCPNPVNPYAVARVSQELISKVYVEGYKVPVYCTRSFNHLGPRQPEKFVVSSFIKQAVEVKLKRRNKISCGNIDIIRDFVDVRDVVRAYILILEKGAPGNIYNVCSGKGILLEDLLKRICDLAKILPDWSVNPSLIRPVDNPAIVGDNQQLAMLGFKPEYSLEQSLKDQLNY